MLANEEESTSLTMMKHSPIKRREERCVIEHRGRCACVSWQQWLQQTGRKRNQPRSSTGSERGAYIIAGHIGRLLTSAAVLCCCIALPSVHLTSSPPPPHSSLSLFFILLVSYLFLFHPSSPPRFRPALHIFDHLPPYATHQHLRM